jgi:hypothetical protein
LAKTAYSAAAIQDYLEMEQRWLALARSYEFSERLSNFTATPLSHRKPAPKNRPPPDGRAGT